jgi:hypothetical protein
MEIEMPEAFICPGGGIYASLQQGIEGAAIVGYCKPTLTPQKQSRDIYKVMKKRGDRNAGGFHLSRRRDLRFAPTRHRGYS